VHLCYVGGQITPLQPCANISFSSSRRNTNRYWTNNELLYLYSVFVPGRRISNSATNTNLQR